ncbi:hypothetical protein AB0469_00420 [Streptomyces sp. NPDC093801]|uniref:hypothetical protein n=1 Tax=Streptomyces sp. NPDC093801 TaxID=3155203 RepID=UPI00344C5981
MRHRLAAITLTAALTGGALLAAAPAQAAPAQQARTTAAAAAAAVSRHDIPRLRQHVEDLYDKAVILDQLGQHADAERTRSEARLLQAIIANLIKSGG